MKSFILILFASVTFVNFCLEAQNKTSYVPKEQLTYIFILNSSDTVYQLPHEFLIEASEKVVLDTAVTLQRTHQYDIDYRYGRINFSSIQLGNILQDSSIHSIMVSYKVYPLPFKREYSINRLEVRKDSVGAKKLFITKQSSSLFTDDVFGPNLQKSGSIVRGFSVGSNRDLTLNSGFRMQLAGKLAKDVNITAALTDENSPIQPEGTTQTLREIDKVFIEITNPQYSATLGDFNLQVDKNQGGEFSRINRKLQGGHGVASFKNISNSNNDLSISVTGATARGKYNTNYFQGKEGMQGPYRLTGKNGENRLLIIAGSERVYLNGELMTRGEVNDYIIDYSSGEITFSSRRLITNASRITVDFEYSDQQFIRNFVGGSISGRIFNDGLVLNMNLIQEADDPDSPIEFSLDDNMRAVLSQSGNDRLKSSLSGINYVGIDSITGVGKGLYVMRDTIIEGKIYSILIYAPNDSLAVYQVRFSPVNYVPVDSPGYDRVTIGQYKFAGIGKGSYIPVQFLPMPQLHRLFDVNGTANISSDFMIAGEYAVSDFNFNRFSSDKISTVNGKALSFSTKYNPKKILIGNKNFGELDMQYSMRFKDKKFFSMDRDNEVEFSRKWDIIENLSEANEGIQELSLKYKPIKTLGMSANYGDLNRPGEAKSTRTQLNAMLSDTSLPFLQYQFERINISNELSNYNSNWTRHLGNADYELLKFRPGLRIESEERLSRQKEKDSLQSGSFRFIEIAPRLTVPQYINMSISAELQFRTEDSAYVGYLSRASKSITQIYNWQYNSYSLISSTLTLSIRKVEFTDEYKLRGNSNSDAVMVRSQTRYTPFQRTVESDLYYEFSNQRSARLERVFVQVSRGDGNYRYVGDRNENGIRDEDDFELTRFDGNYIVIQMPSDQLYPVASLKSSIRLRLQPSRVVKGMSNWVGKVLRSISTDTYLRVDENSTDPITKHIYLLNLKYFLNNRYTITGSKQIMQDLNIFENDPDLSFRFRFNERYGLNKFVTSIERTYNREMSIRIQSQLVKEIANQTDFVNRVNVSTSSLSSLRTYNLNSNSLITDFSYKPFLEWEIGFNIGLMEVINYGINDVSEAFINEEGIRVTRSFLSIGQLRVELAREEVKLKNIVNPPYEMTLGKTQGKTYLWRLVLDYRITNNIQLSLNYNGRIENAQSAIHYLRAEAKAFF